MNQLLQGIYHEINRELMEKENSEFKPVKLRLKIDLVSYPARAEGLVNMNMIRLWKRYLDK